MTGTSLRVDLLGPVRMVVAAHPVALGSGLQLATFVALVCHEGRRASRRDVVKALWETPPPTADGSVYTYITGLRRALATAGASELLSSDRPGYRLRIPPEACDFSVFDDLAGEAAAHVANGDHERGLEGYDRALRLIRGEPLSGVPGPFAEAKRHELSGRLLEAKEARARAGLVLGAHAEVAADLATLIELFPFRESLRELRMLALYQCGRQVEALELFRDTRETLRRELGSEPGSSLRHLHERILRDREYGSGARTTNDADPGRTDLVLPASRPMIIGATRAISSEAQDLLRWLAILGEDVPAKRVVLVLPEGGCRLRDVVDESVSAGLLVTDGIRIRFRHPSLKDVVYRGIRRPFRAVMHMQAARALAAVEASPAAVAEQLIVEDVELDEWSVEWLSANASRLGETTPDLAARLIERTTAECRMSPATRERLRMVLIRALSRLDQLPESIIGEALATMVDPAHITELNRLRAAARWKVGRSSIGSEKPTGASADSVVPATWRARRHVPQQRTRTADVAWLQRRLTGKCG